MPVFPVFSGAIRSRTTEMKRSPQSMVLKLWCLPACLLTAFLFPVAGETAAGDRAATPPLAADRMFSDHMILQRGMPAPVWGTAAPGETVVVSIRNQRKQAKAGTDGKWMVKLDPLKTGAPAALKISGVGDGAITFTNVLVGEVWIGSGQSNMAGNTSGYRRQDEALDAWANDATHMPLRFYDRHNGVWRRPSEPQFGRSSALGFAFIYSLSKELGVPVGMMVFAYGGRPSGEWITPGMAAASADPVLRKLVEPGAEAPPPGGGQAGKRKFLTRETMGVHYRNGISKFRPYAIRGVLWDQGEGGTNLEGVDQFTAMSALIAGWRKDWGNDDLPFLHMQKPSGGGCAWDPANPVNRGARELTPQPTGPSRMKPDRMFYRLNHIRMGTIPNAPLVTTVDLARGVHPPTKSAYGARAVRVALGTVYGRDVETCGPVYRSHTVEGGRIRVTFDHVGKGLAFRHSEKLQGFEIAGSDGAWRWAEATIDGATVVVHHADIPSPTQVRYAYWPEPSYANLFNKDGLPALTFTTERLPRPTTPSRGR